MIKTFFDLEVFKLSYQIAMDIFNMTRNFPKEERYSLTDQIVRSSRSYQQILQKDGGKEYMKMSSKGILYIRWDL